MSKSTKYKASLIIIIFSIIFLTREVSYDFSRTKWLYASFYPDKYFEKDVILYERQTSGHREEMYYFYGTLKKHKIKARVFYNESDMKKLWKPNLEIPVWYCNLNRNVIIRTDKIAPKPFSYQLLNSQMTVLIWLLSIPASIYIITYRIQKQKTKSLKTK